MCEAVCECVKFCGDEDPDKSTRYSQYGPECKDMLPIEIEVDDKKGPYDPGRKKGEKDLD